MSKAFDIQKMAKECGIQLGNPGARNEPDVEEITRNIQPFTEDKANLVVSQTGGLAASSSDEFKKFQKENPDLANKAQQIGEKPGSFTS